MAGPLAGTAGMPFVRFYLSKLLGATIYVPVVVAGGYGIGYRLGDYIAWFEQVVGRVEQVVLNRARRLYRDNLRVESPSWSRDFFSASGIALILHAFRRLIG